MADAKFEAFMASLTALCAKPTSEEIFISLQDNSPIQGASLIELTSDDELFDRCEFASNPIFERRSARSDFEHQIDTFLDGPILPERNKAKQGLFKRLLRHLRR